MNKENLKELLDKMEQEDSDLEKELNRILELFKQLEFDQKLEKALDKLSDLKAKQKALKEKKLKKTIKDEQLSKEQEKLNEEFDNLKKELEELKEKNQALEEKNNMPDTKAQEEEISKKMQESKDNLQQNKKKKRRNRQNLKRKLWSRWMSYSKKLQSLQSSSCSNIQQEDMETLRQILENLIRLSFDQEELMGKVKVTPKNSPNYVGLVKEQKKLVDDAKIIEDSLFTK